MRTRWRMTSGLLGLLLLSSPVGAQTFSSGSTGADGPFSPPTTVPPGTTVNGSTYTVPLPPSGIFHFTTITIPSGLTVTFTRNAANAPVILLATGSVSIAGTLDVSGAPAGLYGRPGPGGPGGFSGGPGADGGFTSAFGSPGLGPGGGGVGSQSGGAGGGYGTPGQPGTCNSFAFTCTSFSPAPAGPTYGSLTLRPILGGSGGGGGYGPSTPAGGGGGGGGALILATSGTLTLTGTIRAEGGLGGGGGPSGGGGGSGGAIRLIGTALTGSGGILRAVGGTGGGSGGMSGGEGRIRLEAYDLGVSLASVVPSASNGYPQAVFPPAGQPTLAFTSVAGQPVPSAPKGTFLDPPDITLPPGTTSPIAVSLAATNIPLGTILQVSATPQAGTTTTALSTPLSGTLASSTATASVSILTDRASILTATATFPLVASLGSGPLYVDGEEVTHVKVAAVFGGPSRITYLTRSGREILVP